MVRALARVGAVALASIVTAASLAGVGRLIVYGDVPLLPFSRSTGVALPGPGVVVETPTLRAVTPPRSLAESPTPEPTPAETTPPTAIPAPTAAPFGITPFRFSGRSYLGLVARETTPTFVAPFAGSVEIRLYQFIENEVRVGSNVPSLPFFPYIAVVSADSRMIYRPGALRTVTEILVTDGKGVVAGDPLFRVVGPGRSSWATFYDARVQYQVVVSLQAIPSGRDLDPATYFAGN